MFTPLAGAGGALILVSALGWSGCTPTPENYELLSFFFDGVPDPSAVRMVEGQALSIADIRASPNYTIHQPYAEDKCADCHSARFRLTRDDSGACVKCHEDQLAQHPRMHGPVVACACLWCHEPHESAHAVLLREPGRGICIQCHVQELLSAERVPEHADETRACLECHYGHGGATPAFLRTAGAEPTGK
jgi:predicted CXXCH cytochrome family protein